MEERFDQNEKEMENIKESLARISHQMEEQGKEVAILVSKISGTKSWANMSESGERSSLKRKLPDEVVEIGGSTKDRVTQENEKELTYDRSKFKKVEMSIFSGDDPDAWVIQGRAVL